MRAGISRRDFVERCAQWLAAASVSFSAACASRHAVGIQLYTVRDLMARDPDATLRALAAIGYDEVEFAGLHGRPAADLRRLLDDLKLTAPAGHVGLDRLRSELPAVLEEAATLGWRWIVMPWIDAGDRTAAGYARVAAELNRLGERARERGLRIAYHNHDYAFAPLAGGRTGYDILLEECRPELVDMELDLFWAVHAGRDPVEYVERFPGRFPMVHVKDRAADGRMVNVGAGTIDFARIVARAGSAGIRHWFIEHDEPADPLRDAAASLAAFRQLLH